MKKNTLAKRRGATLVYTTITMTAICLLLSMAVDYGRAQLVKTELRVAADAAARAAAAYIYEDLSDATSAAVAAAKVNKADGKAVDLVAAQDIQYGRWDVNTRKFTTGVSSSMVNAVRVIARRTQARGNAVPMLLSRIRGFNYCNVEAETIVMAIEPLNVDQDVPAEANPFLSGMPKDSIASAINPHRNPDYAGTTSNPKQSPLAINMPIAEGQTLNFDSITGTVRHDPNLDYTDPDGVVSASEPVGHNNVSLSHSNNYGPQMYNENGIADAWIPINALVGVFLDDKAPNMSAAPDNLDFRDADSRNFTELKPKLKQLFFIGDGKNSSGQRQNFIAPPGATRLYLATMDYYEWNNNAGKRRIRVIRPGQIITVK